MATWNDVRRIALALPETSEGESRGLASWQVRSKGIRVGAPTSPGGRPRLGRRGTYRAVLGARVEHLVAKEALLANDPNVFLTTPHFDGFPAVLVRLETISVEDLEEVIVEAWLARAPKRLAQKYVEETLGPEPG